MKIINQIFNKFKEIKKRMSRSEIIKSQSVTDSWKYRLWMHRRKKNNDLFKKIVS